MTGLNLPSGTPHRISDRDLANAVRALSMDAVERAKSGHPGLAMGMADAEKDPLGGILTVNGKPLVSSDFNHNPASSIFDLNCSTVVDGVFDRVVSWYDNEWGFSNRMLDTAAAMGALLR